MDSSSKARFARLGPTRALDRVPSGSPAVLSLRPGPIPADLKTVAAAISLARRGVSLLRAKRAVEEMLSSGRTVLRLPAVEDAAALARELGESGIRVAVIPPDAVDVRALRERLNLTQEQFALRYGLDLGSLRNWEVHRREPDTATRSYLRVIERLPGPASEALEVALG